jgi:hypothetical protein
MVLAAPTATPAAGLKALKLAAGAFSVVCAATIGDDRRLPTLYPKPKKRPQSRTRPKNRARMEPVLSVNSRWAAAGMSSWSSRR